MSLSIRTPASVSVVALLVLAAGCTDRVTPTSLATCPTREPIAVPPGGEVFLRGQGCLWSESLVLTANGTFERNFRGCEGGSYSSGAVDRSATRIVLHDPRASDMPSADGVRALDPLLVVDWGERRYLVPEEMALDFCNAVNNRREPRAAELDGYFFIRQGDPLLPTTGRPALPQEWSRLVLDHVVESTTSEPGPDRTAWISLGSRNGLSAEMELTLHDLPTAPEVIARGAPAFSDQPLTIIELASDRCRVAYKWGNALPAIPMSLRVTTGAELLASK